jgi:DNA modification methylase
MTCWQIRQGDWIEVLRTMPDESVHCVVTSPPYWGLRDYGVSGQLGLERTPDEYVAKMVEGFREVRRVLRNDGTLWLNLGDSYSGGGNYRGVDSEDTLTSKQSSNRGARGLSQLLGTRDKETGCKPKDLVGIPWLMAFALRADGWYLRQDIIWSKPNPMPESVRDRCTKAHEYIFLLSKSERYYYDQDAILEPVSLSTHARLSQEVEAQIGSERANGGQKTNGNMKAVGRSSWKGSEFHTGKTGEHQLGRSQKDRKLAEPGSGIKSNESFSNAVCLLVEQRNKRSVWNVTTRGYSEAHFATFPPEIPETCIKAGCPENGTVLDPFNGAGTTGLVATRLGRNYIGIELNPEYIAMATKRIEQDAPLLNAREVTLFEPKPEQLSLGDAHE